jgi:hypothetical protein
VAPWVLAGGQPLLRPAQGVLSFLPSLTVCPYLRHRPTGRKFNKGGQFWAGKIVLLWLANAKTCATFGFIEIALLGHLLTLICKGVASLSLMRGWLLNCQKVVTAGRAGRGVCVSGILPIFQQLGNIWLGRDTRVTFTRTFEHDRKDARLDSLTPAEMPALPARRQARCLSSHCRN